MVICDVVFNYVLLFPLGELTRCYLAIHYFTFTSILSEKRFLCRCTHTHRVCFTLLSGCSPQLCKSQNISPLSLQEDLKNVCYCYIFNYRSWKAFSHYIAGLICHGSTVLKVFYFLRCFCARKASIQGVRYCNPPCFVHYPFMEEEVLPFHVRVLCFSTEEMGLFKSRGGGSYPCLWLHLVTVRKPFLKYAWLVIIIYKKKLTYLLKHWLSSWQQRFQWSQCC